MKTAAELVGTLISAVWEHKTPGEAELSLVECMELWRRLADGESKAGEQIGSDVPAPDDKCMESGRRLPGPKGISEFKHTTMTRLRAYREKRGLGSFARLAEMAGDGVDDDVIRRIFAGERFPIETWRAVAAALDKEEAG